jgi:DNA-binding NarL/FixJ family response regulator
LRRRLTLVVADAQPTWRLGIRTAFENEGFTVAAEAATGAELVVCALSHRPDACVLDVDIRGGGVDAAHRIAARLPRTAVVILASVPADDELIAALRAGASGYLPKATDGRRLVAAVRGVLAGEAAIPRRMLPSLIDEIRIHDRRRHVTSLGERGVRLTPREWEVLELFAREVSTRDIAAELGISAVTVRRHVSEVLRKFGVADRETARQLVREAWDSGSVA